MRISEQNLGEASFERHSRKSARACRDAAGEPESPGVRLRVSGCPPTVRVWLTGWAVCTTVLVGTGKIPESNRDSVYHDSSSSSAVSVTQAGTCQPTGPVTQLATVKPKLRLRLAGMGRLGVKSGPLTRTRKTQCIANTFVVTSIVPVFRQYYPRDGPGAMIISKSSCYYTLLNFFQ